jgi:hypothetical protein
MRPQCPVMAARPGVDQGICNCTGIWLPRMRWPGSLLTTAALRRVRSTPESSRSGPVLNAPVDDDHGGAKPARGPKPVRAAGQSGPPDRIVVRISPSLYRRPELRALIEEHRQRALIEEHRQQAREALTLTGLAVQIDQLRGSPQGDAPPVPIQLRPRFRFNCPSALPFYAATPALRGRLGPSRAVHVHRFR